MVPDKLILESCQKIIKKTGLIANVRDIYEHLLYCIDAEAYDLIYGLKKEDINIQEILKILNAHYCTYSYENRVYNQAQQAWPFYFTNKKWRDKNV